MENWVGNGDEHVHILQMSVLTGNLEEMSVTRAGFLGVATPYLTSFKRLKIYSPERQLVGKYNG